MEVWLKGEAYAREPLHFLVLMKQEICLLTDIEVNEDRKGTYIRNERCLIEEGPGGPRKDNYF